MYAIFLLKLDQWTLNTSYIKKSRKRSLPSSAAGGSAVVWNNENMIRCVTLSSENELSDNKCAIDILTNNDIRTWDQVVCDNFTTTKYPKQPVYDDE